MSYGMDARIGLSFQNSYGTLSVSSLHWLEPTGESVDVKKAQITQEGMRGIYDDGRNQEGANTVDGDVTIEAKPIPLGVLLSAAFNKISSTASGSIYSHLFRPRTADHSVPCAERPFTMMKFMGDVGSAHVYSDLCASQMELNISNGELLTAKMSVVGGSFSQSAAVAASYIAGDALDWSVSSITMGGTAKTTVREMSVSLDNAIEAQHTLGAATKYPTRIKRTGNRTVEVSGTLLFEDQTEFQQFISQTEQRLAVHLKGRSEIQSGYTESLLIDVPSFRFTEFPQAIGGPGQIEVSFSGAAKYNTGSGQSISLTLVNTQSTY